MEEKEDENVTELESPIAYNRIMPNQTIYINNLNDKIKKFQLRKSLYYAFSAFGYIFDIVTLKTEKLRGQAWIVFDSIETATNAVKSMNGFMFFGKEMVF